MFVSEGAKHVGRSLSPARGLVLAIAGFLAAATGNQAQAQAPLTITVAPPFQDAFVRELAPTLGYGAAGALAVGGVNSVNVLGQPRGRFDSVMQFETAPAVQAFDTAFGAGGWTITGVTLRLVEDAAPNNAVFPHGLGTFEVRWLSNDNWVQGAGTAGMPSVAGGDEMSWNYLQSLLALPETTEASLGTFANTLVTEPHFFDLAAEAGFVSDIAAGGSLSLHLQPVSNTVGFVFNSGDFPVAANRPMLFVTAVPEPAGLILLCTAMLLVPRRRR